LEIQTPQPLGVSNISTFGSFFVGIYNIMKAKLVLESIDFRRNISSRKSMRVGYEGKYIPTIWTTSEDTDFWQDKESYTKYLEKYPDMEYINNYYVYLVDRDLHGEEVIRIIQSVDLLRHRTHPSGPVEALGKLIGGIIGNTMSDFDFYVLEEDSEEDNYDIHDLRVIGPHGNDVEWQIVQFRDENS
jgi:hypothetical protein